MAQNRRVILFLLSIVLIIAAAMVALMLYEPPVAPVEITREIPHDRIFTP